MPKYEIYLQQSVTYQKVYEGAHRGEAWKQFYDDLYAGRLRPIDTDETYSHVEEVED